jgi:hypothetical protein
VLSRPGFELGETGLQRGVLQAQPGRFPACGRGFLSECREEIPKLLQPLEECRGICAGTKRHAFFRSHQTAPSG